MIQEYANTPKPDRNMPNLDDSIRVIERYVNGRDEFVLDGDIISKSAVHFNLQQKQAEDFISTMLTLIKAPSDLQGILICEKALLILLEEILANSDLLDEDKNLSVKVMKYWLSCAKEAPPERLYSKAPAIRKSPFFAFFREVSTMLDSDLNGQATAFYRFFCLTFSAAIKRALSDSLENSSYEVYGRGLRYLCLYSPANINLRKSHLENDLKTCIKKAIENYDINKNGNKTGTHSDLANYYETVLSNLLVIQKRMHPHPHEGSKQYQYLAKGEVFTSVEPGLEIADGRIKLLDETTTPPKALPIKAVSTNYIGLPGDEDDTDEGLDMDLYYDDRLDAEAKVVPRVPSLSRAFCDAIHMRYYEFPWDSKYPSIYHHSILLRAIEDSWSNASEKKRAVMVHVLIMMQTGISPEMLFQVGVTTGTEGPKSFNEFPILLQKIGNLFYIYKTAPVTYSTEFYSGGIFRPISSIIRVPLSPTTSAYISDSGLNTSKPGFFFSLKEPYNATVVNFDALKKYLKPINEQYGLNLSAYNISLSFFHIYHARFGLDAIKACYISGQHYRKFSSQLHYVHLSPQELEAEYLQISENVEASIRKNIAMLIKLKKIPDYANRETIPSMTDTQPCCSNKVTHGYGSPFVPFTEGLTSYLEKLKITIEKLEWSEIIERHNLFMIYTYLCMQYSFAYRPRNKVPFEFDKFAEGHYVVINDKQSSTYNELRVLPSTDILQQLAGNVRMGFEKVKRYILRKKGGEISQLYPKSFFFFLTQKGGYKEFSLKELRSCLVLAGLEYPFDMKTPRHFVRTYLYEKGFCNDLADAFLGHTHTAKEPLGVSSSLMYSGFTLQTLGAINNMLKEIGITTIPYAPEGNDLI